ncbi:MAG: DNA-binding protein [Candidatus Helarchaeota archaeon]
MSDDELEQIRKRKMMEIQAQAQQQEAIKRQQQEIEAQKNAIMRKILSPEARMRLENIRMVRSEFAQQVELQMIQLAQTGQLARAGIQTPLSDADFKKILQKLQGKKKDIKIRHI